jgi:hypothetical protein
LSFAKPIFLPKKPNLNHHTKTIHWSKNSTIFSINWDQESEAKGRNKKNTILKYYKDNFSNPYLFFFSNHREQILSKPPLQSITSQNQTKSKPKQKKKNQNREKKKKQNLKLFILIRPFW